MSRNGSGVYTLPAGNPVVSGTTITSSWANNTMNDIASALTGSLAADGQTPATGNLNMANNRIISVADPFNAQDAATKAYADALIGGGGSAGVFTNVTDSALTSGRVTYASTGGLLVDSANLTFNGTTLTSTGFSGPLNGTVGATTPNTGAFTTLSASGAFSANGGATLGDASGDALTINSSAVSIPNGLNFDSNTFVIDATNNRVGVGTAGPDQKLQVITASGSDGIEVSTASGASRRRVLMTVDGTAGYIDSYNFAGSAGASLSLNPNGGNVGIGTNTPSYKLHIAGQSAYLTSGASTALTFIDINSAYGTIRTGIDASGVGYFGSVSNFALALYTNNSERLRIDTSGNVGITSSPGAKLDVAGNAQVSAGQFTVGVTATSGLQFISNGTFGTIDSIPLVFRTVSAERMRIDTSGSVGINTASPNFGGNTVALAVNGSSSSALNLKVADVGAFTVSSGSGITTLADGRASTVMSFSLGGSERMRIDSSGNVGIGITPSAWATYTALSVKQLSLASFTNGDGRVVNNAYYDSANWRYIDTRPAVMYLLDANGANHTWSTAASGTAGAVITWSERMRIDSSGNVCIGTTTGVQPLTIGGSGNMYATAGATWYTGGDLYIRAGTSGLLRLGANNTNDLIIVNTNGNLVLQNGTTTANGTGITFPANQSASTDANCLDDYEEGTFTPTAVGGTTAGTTTYTLQAGIYTKIGRQVTISILLNYSALTGTGNLTVGNLPFTSNSSYEFVGSVMVDGLNWGGGTQITPYIGSSQNAITFYYFSDDGAWAAQQCVNEAVNFRITLTYFV